MKGDGAMVQEPVFAISGVREEGKGSKGKLVNLGSRAVAVGPILGVIYEVTPPPPRARGSSAQSRP